MYGRICERQANTYASNRNYDNSAEQNNVWTMLIIVTMRKINLNTNRSHLYIVIHTQKSDFRAWVDTLSSWIMNMVKRWNICSLPETLFSCPEASSPCRANLELRNIKFMLLEAHFHLQNRTVQARHLFSWQKVLLFRPESRFVCTQRLKFIR